MIDDAWVFSKLLVTVHMMPTAEELSHVFINLSVLESDSKINSAAIQAQSQPMLADIDGLLTNVTPKTLADTITFDHQGKALSLELYRDLVVDYGGTAFDLSILLRCQHRSLIMSLVWSRVFRWLLTMRGLSQC